MQKLSSPVHSPESVCNKQVKFNVLGLIQINTMYVAGMPKECCMQQSTGPLI